MTWHFASLKKMIPVFDRHFLQFQLEHPKRIYFFIFSCCIVINSLRRLSKKNGNPMFVNYFQNIEVGKHCMEWADSYDRMVVQDVLSILKILFWESVFEIIKIEELCRISHHHIRFSSCFPCLHGLGGLPWGLTR